MKKNIMFIQSWNYRQRKHLLVHNPCKNGSGWTTSKRVIWRKGVLPTKNEFALPGAIFRVKIFAKPCFRKGSFSMTWKTRTGVLILAFKSVDLCWLLDGILRKRDFTSLFFKSYCDRGCFWAKYLSNHFFNNFVVYKHVSVVCFHTNFFKISTS